MTSSDSRRALPPLTFEGAFIGWLMKILSISVLGLFVSMNLGRVYSQAAERAADFKANHAWVSPLEISPRLSGNFGELRGNHFHTGVDLKTEGREGLVVLAATSGRVARVKMSPWGYGNALYLEGPDDVTTVYAHLQRFAPRVQQWAVQRTYKTRTLGLDAAPSAGDSLYFEAGDTLGWSGNSGGSGGPHLHFEVRQTSNQHPLNPLDGWLDKSDSRKPVLPKLWAESELGMRSWSWTEDTVRVPLKVRFAVEGYDLLDGASNICGLRTLEATLTTPDGERFSSGALNHQLLPCGVAGCVSRDDLKAGRLTQRQFHETVVFGRGIDAQSIGENPVQSVHLVPFSRPNGIKCVGIHVLVHPKIQFSPRRTVRQQHLRPLFHDLGFQRPQAANVGRTVQHVVPLD